MITIKYINTKVRCIISNCLLEHKLQNEGCTQNYNTRVVECRLPAKLLGIKDYKHKIKTLEMFKMNLVFIHIFNSYMLTEMEFFHKIFVHVNVPGIFFNKMR